MHFIRQAIYSYKPYKNITQIKLKAIISGEYRYKNFQQNTCKLSFRTHLKDHTSWSSGIPPWSLIKFQYTKLKNEIPHINRMKGKNHIINSIDAEKAFDKIQHLFMRKTLNKLNTEGKYINIIKSIYGKLTANIILASNSFEIFSSKKTKVPTFYWISTWNWKSKPEQSSK